MELRSVEFTGGTSPYVWFGDGKRDNIHDGNGFGGQVIAAVEKEFYFQYDYSYPGRVEVAFYKEYREGYYLIDSCQIPRVSCLQDDEKRPVVFLDSVVNNCEFIPGMHTIQATLKEGTLITESFTIPNLEPLSLVSADLTPPTDTVDGNIEVTVKGGRAPYFFTQQGLSYQRSEGVFNEITNPFQWSYRPIYDYLAIKHFPALQVDLYENVYVQSGKSVDKVNKNGEKLWGLEISNGFINQLYVDPNGTLYVSGIAESGFNLEGRHLGVDTSTSFIARINTNGQLEWLRKIGTDEIIAINSNKKGSLYLLTGSLRFIKMRVNGSMNYSVLLNTEYKSLREFGKIAFDDKGNVYAASSNVLNYSPTTVLSKITEDGNVVFSKRLEGAGVVRGMIYRPYTNLVIIDYQYGPHIFYMTTFRSYNDDGTLSYVNTLDLYSNTFPGVAFDQAGLPYVLFQDATMHQLDMFGAIVHSYKIGDGIVFPQIVIDEVGNFHIATHSGYIGDFPITPTPSGYTDLFKFSPPEKRNILIPSGWSDVNILLEDVSNQSISLNLNFTTTSITGINANLDNSAYEISWQPALAAHNGYEVYEKAGESLNLIASVDKDLNSFTHYTSTDIPEKPEYIIRVLTVNGENQSQPHSPAVLSAKAETGGKVDLTWQPYTGYDNPAYTLYRGADEFSMEPVSKLTGEQLSYIDKLPASGDYLYRLEVTGKDGSSMSNTVSVSSDASEHTVALWPNPATDMINCRWEGRSRTNTLQLSDVQGRIMAEYSNVDPGGYHLQRSELPAGIYLLTFEDASGKTTERIVFK
jgi:hypothetical protein